MESDAVFSMDSQDDAASSSSGWGSGWEEGTSSAATEPRDQQWGASGGWGAGGWADPSDTATPSTSAGNGWGSDGFSATPQSPASSWGAMNMTTNDLQFIPYDEAAPSPQYSGAQGQGPVKRGAKTLPQQQQFSQPQSDHYGAFASPLRSDFLDEEPLLTELGINFEHIKFKTFSGILSIPFRLLDVSVLPSCSPEPSWPHRPCSDGGRGHGWTLLLLPGLGLLSDVVRKDTFRLHIQLWRVWVFGCVCTVEFDGPKWIGFVSNGVCSWILSAPNGALGWDFHSVAFKWYCRVMKFLNCVH